MTAVIEIEGLRKHYRSSRRRARAVDGLDLSVAEGEIHGLLGPNASGKTTALRALLGLVRADAGRMRVFDRDVPRNLPRVLGAVGAVLDKPRFFDDFTARRTLRLLATTAGVKRRRVAEVLAQVGLSGNTKDRVGSYSQGMKQRLALAAALLKEPQLLILDEPCAGLDPAGITEMRALLRALAEDGVTVLVASHILADVQQLCDTVTIISRGQRIATGPVAALLASQDKGDVRVRASDLTAAAKLVADAGLPVEVYDDHMVVSDIADPAWISEALGRKRLWVSELTPLPPDLESVYLSLAGGYPTLPGQVDQLAELSGLLDAQTPAVPDTPAPAPAPAEPAVAEPAVAEQAPPEPAPEPAPDELPAPVLDSPDAVESLTAPGEEDVAATADVTPVSAPSVSPAPVIALPTDPVSPAPISPAPISPALISNAPISAVPVSPVPTTTTAPEVTVDAADTATASSTQAADADTPADDSREEADVTGAPSLPTTPEREEARP